MNLSVTRRDTRGAITVTYATYILTTKGRRRRRRKEEEEEEKRVNNKSKKITMNHVHCARISNVITTPFNINGINGITI